MSAAPVPYGWRPVADGFTWSIYYDAHLWQEAWETMVVLRQFSSLATLPRVIGVLDQAGRATPIGLHCFGDVRKVYHLLWFPAVGYRGAPISGIFAPTSWLKEDLNNHCIRFRRSLDEVPAFIAELAPVE